jgi:hypothetical protein
VIAFLVITTVINIALGYALAVYLGGASSSGSEAFDFASAAPRTVNAFPPAPERLIAESLANALSMAAAQSMSTASTMQAVDSVAAKPSAVQVSEEAPERQFRTAEMEQDLLAGIEEFRNQLAQLKGQNFEEGVPELAAAGE